MPRKKATAPVVATVGEPTVDTIATVVETPAEKDSDAHVEPNTVNVDPEPIVDHNDDMETPAETILKIHVETAFFERRCVWCDCDCGDGMYGLAVKIDGVAPVEIVETFANHAKVHAELAENPEWVLISSRC